MNRKSLRSLFYLMPLIFSKCSLLRAFIRFKCTFQFRDQGLCTFVVKIRSLFVLDLESLFGNLIRYSTKLFYYN